MDSKSVSEFNRIISSNSTNNNYYFERMGNNFWSRTHKIIFYDRKFACRFFCI